LAPEVVANLRDLVSKLQPIENFMTQQSRRHGVQRFLMHKADATKIENYRRRLSEALDEFQLRSNINVEDGVAQMGKKLEDLMEKLENWHVNGSYAHT
jgi:hypothetical protein